MVFIFQILVAFLLAAFGSADFDCQGGCVLTSNLVCGENGLTFMGECLAFCAGVNVRHRGACLPSSTYQIAATSETKANIAEQAQTQDLTQHPFARE